MATVAVLTNAGRVWETNLVNGDAPAQPKYLGWGTGAGTAAKEDASLFNASAEARVMATLSKPTTTTWKLVGTITSASAQTITNVGVFDDPTAGNMVYHVSFSGDPLEIGDAITFEITRYYPA